MDERKNTKGIISSSVTCQSHSSCPTSRKWWRSPGGMAYSATERYDWHQGLATTIEDDNMSTIALRKNHVLHDKSKHIDTKFHLIHESVDRGRIDVPMKSVGHVQLCEPREKIGIVKFK